MLLIICVNNYLSFLVIMYMNLVKNVIHLKRLSAIMHIHTVLRPSPRMLIQMKVDTIRMPHIDKVESMNVNLVSPIPLATPSSIMNRANAGSDIATSFNTSLPFSITLASLENNDII